MMTDWMMICTWIGAGMAIGFLLTNRLLAGLARGDSEEKIRAYAVENEALKRTNNIYRERIDQLEDALFSNRKYHSMAREIEKLSASNYKLRSRLKDLECLVEAERKRNSRERVEYLERKVEQLKRRLKEKEREKEYAGYETIIPVEVLPAGHEVAVSMETVDKDGGCETQESRKGWSTITRARRI